MEKKLQDQCICSYCPSYVNCGEPRAFCLPGSSLSQCIKSQSGCVCPGCPVYEQMVYKGEYFCLHANPA